MPQTEIEDLRMVQEAKEPHHIVKIIQRLPCPHQHHMRDGLPAVLLGLYESDYFKLGTKPKHLNKKGYDGIVWHGDLCLFRECVLYALRQQPGYRNLSDRDFAQELTDCAALVVHKNGTKDGEDS